MSTTPHPVMLLPQESYQLDELLQQFELIFEQFEADLPKSGSKVLLKPNLVKSAERQVCAQTDPEFMRALIIACQKRDWQVTVGDSPAIGSARQVGRPSGLTAVCDELKVPLISLDGASPYEIHGRKTTLAKNLKDFDAIINVPKLKGHGQLYYTGAVKNLYGCVGGKRKVARHMSMGDKDGGRVFARMLLDTAEIISPCLTIMDGIRAMAGRGPLHGKPVSENILVASNNAVAMDWAMLHHLGGALNEDPALNLVDEDTLYHTYKNCELLTPQGLPPRGEFYFPAKEERKPISFHPWILLRFAFRNLKSKWAG